MILPGTGRGTGEAGGGGAGQALRPEVATARTLRRDMSLPEVLLWQKLRGGTTGLKFRRQHPIGPYIADFCCLARRLVVEIDGTGHDCSDRPARDLDRITFIEENGFRVIRIPARDVLRDACAVAASIAALVSTPLHQPVAGPPPRAGEDQE